MYIKQIYFRMGIQIGLRFHTLWNGCFDILDVEVDIRMRWNMFFVANISQVIGALSIKGRQHDSQVFFINYIFKFLLRAPFSQKKFQTFQISTFKHVVDLTNIKCWDNFCFHLCFWTLKLAKKFNIKNSFWEKSF